jgi:ABC-type dipeptide/oligopeptide/nickel transport system ATPase subunit
MYTLEFENVTKRYGHEVVVDDLTFTVQPGRVTGFLGPNGAGKSTAMKILLDLAKADHGRATIAGTRYREMPDPHLHHVGHRVGRGPGRSRDPREPSRWHISPGTDSSRDLARLDAATPAPLTPTEAAVATDRICPLNSDAHTARHRVDQGASRRTWTSRSSSISASAPTSP